MERGKNKRELRVKSLGVEKLKRSRLSFAGVAEIIIIPLNGFKDWIIC